MEIDKAKLQKIIKDYFNGKVPAAVQNAVNSASAEDIKKAEKIMGDKAKLNAVLQSEKAQEYLKGLNGK